jgi:hypothetical protein
MVKIVRIPQGKITNVPRVNLNIGKKLKRQTRPFRNDFNFSILEE